MKKSILLLVLVCFFVVGCGPEVIKTETSIYELFEKDFNGFELPDIQTIKGAGKGRFPNIDFEEAWDSVIIVLMQQGIILKTSKESGVIVGMGRWPLGVYIERGEPLYVHIRVITNLYRRLDEPEQTAFDFQAMNLEDIHKQFYDKLSTQIYSRQKWKYLYSDTAG